jgi:hypothetical protein
MHDSNHIQAARSSHNEASQCLRRVNVCSIYLDKAASKRPFGRPTSHLNAFEMISSRRPTSSRMIQLVLEVSRVVDFKFGYAGSDQVHESSCIAAFTLDAIGKIPSPMNHEKKHGDVTVTLWLIQRGHRELYPRG